MKPIEIRKTEIDAYAKINLSLDITGVRTDGYHEVAMIMQTIPLRDKITLTSVPRKTPGSNTTITIQCDDRSLPTNQKNIAWKAARLMLDTFPAIQAATEAITITIQKKIPVGGGLGGSSADGAGVLRGMNAHFTLGLKDEDLMDLGAKLGADVPFQVLGGGTGLASGTGTAVTRLPSLEKGTLLICDPGFTMMTKEVYRQYDAMTVPPHKHPDTKTLVTLLRAGEQDEFCKRLKNVLEIPAFYMKPQLATLKTVIQENGAQVALMSGSGACLYGIFQRESVARKAAWVLESQYGCNTFICDISRLR